MDKLRGLFPGGVFVGKPGEWAQFRIGPAPYQYLRYSVLSKEQVPGGEGLWTEVDLGPTPEGPGFIGLKMLTQGDPVAGSKMLRGIFRLSVGKATELSADKLAKVGHSSKARTEVGWPSADQAEPERKMVPAGTFDAVKVKQQGLTVWLAADAPVFHLVRMDIGPTTMELYATGHDAQDRVGQPQQKLPPPQQGAADGGAG